MTQDASESSYMLLPVDEQGYSLNTIAHAGFAEADKSDEGDSQKDSASVNLVEKRLSFNFERESDVYLS